MEWAWVPDQDGTPDKPIAKPPPAADTKGNPATAPNASEEADSSDPAKANEAYSAEKLARWKPGQLKELLTGLGLDASGCREKQDIIDKIIRHPGGSAAAAGAAAARGEPVDVLAAKIEVSGQDGEGGGAGGGGGGGSDDGTTPAEETDAAVAAADGEEQDGFVGMTLADYIGRPTDEAGNDLIGGGGNGDPRPGGAGGGRPGARGGGTRSSGGGGGGGPPSVAGSTASGRAELSSAASGRGGKVVRLAPAHIAPPSRPAPEWVVVAQVGVWYGRQCTTTSRAQSAIQDLMNGGYHNRLRHTTVKPTANRIPALRRCVHCMCY